MSVAWSQHRAREVQSAGKVAEVISFLVDVLWQNYPLLLLIAPSSCAGQCMAHRLARMTSNSQDHGSIATTQSMANMRHFASMPRSGQQEFIRPIIVSVPAWHEP